MSDSSTALTTTSATTSDTSVRPSEMGMTVQSGMLRTLGINLYTSLGKVLVEFVANAYDGDATKVEITIPEERIKAERARLRAEAKKAAAQAVPAIAADGDQGCDTSDGTMPTAVPAPHVGGPPEAPAPEMATSAGEALIEESVVVGDDAAIDAGGGEGDGDGDGDGGTGPMHARFDVLMQILPDDVEVVIQDDGHGMSWEDVQDKFLPVNRQRRLDTAGRETRLTTAKGRHVMGRKGVGKLAGFGAALTVEVWSTREGEDYATVLKLTDELLNHSTNISDIKIPVTYPPAPAAQKGTRITLSRLKSDALRESLATVQKSISRSFHAIRPVDFAILVNDAPLASPASDYEFVYPSTLDPAKVAIGEMADDVIEVPDLGSIPIRYYVGFLPRSQHLKSAERGARIYCNNRLAAGPSLFDLGTGMHSFHSADYMECVVEADELDRDSIDLINTARTQFKEGNEIVDALRAKLTGIMHQAIAAHGRFRDKQAKVDLNNDPKARIIMKTVATLPSKSRKAATRLLTTMAAQWGVGTAEFEDIAPTIVHSINATDVLIRLVSQSTSPETIGTILGQLRELSEIEKRDTLKLYRGRRGAIEKLETLHEKGREDWHKRASEKKLHELFKECPWLIRPEFSNYIASDAQLTTTVSRIARELKVDEFADAPPPPVENDGEEDTRRPDLVFVMSDPMIDGPHTLKIVELKSPSLPLRIEHYRQLEDYLTVIRRWCDNNLSHGIRYHGYLIGAMPKPNSSNTQEYALLQKFKSIGPRDEIQVLGLTELIRDARTVHVEAIRSLEKDLDEDGADADDDAVDDEVTDGAVTPGSGAEQPSTVAPDPAGADEVPPPDPDGDPEAAAA